MITEFNMPDCVSGDHCDEQSFYINFPDNSPVDLTGARIQVRTVRDANILSTDDTDQIEITSAVGGEFVIKEQKIDWPADLYDYRLSITFADGRKKTFVIGTWNII